MIPYYGDYPEDHAAIRIPFNTFSSNDPSASVTVTNLADADIMVHKDGSLTQIATDGASVVIDFDGITGNHMILIDSSVDAAYSTGSEYAVRVEGITVDAGTLNAWIGTFSIERAGGVLAYLKAGSTVAASVTGAVGSVTGAVGSVTGAVGSVTGSVGSVVGHTAQTGDTYALANGATGFAAIDTVVDGIQTDLSNATDGLGAIKADTAAILVDTAVIGAAGAGLTAVPWNAAWDAEVQSEVQDAIEANHLDHLLAADYDPASKPGVATALLNEMVESDAGVSRFTVNALENAPSGSGASAAAIADAVWDELQADHVAAGSFGLVASEIADILVDTAEIGAAGAGLTALATAAALATVDTNVDAILVDTAVIGAAGAGLTAVPWNAAWDAEVQSEVNDGLVAYDAATGTDVPTAAVIADAVWDEAKAGHVAAGSFGEEVQAHALSTEISALNDITAVAAADALLGRNVAGGSSSGRTVSQAVMRLRNRVAIAAGTMTVYAEDDTTSSWTAAVTTTAGNPVSQVDPA